MNQITFLNYSVKPNQQKRMDHLNEELLSKGFRPGYPYPGTPTNYWTWGDGAGVLTVFYKVERNIIIVTKRTIPGKKGRSVLLVIKDNAKGSINKVLDCVDLQILESNSLKVFDNVHVHFGNYDAAHQFDINFVELGLTDKAAVECFMKAINSINKPSITIGTSSVVMLSLIDSWFKFSKLDLTSQEHVKNIDYIKNAKITISNVMIYKLTSNLDDLGYGLITPEEDKILDLVSDFNDEIRFVL